ncbi:ABC transporter permease family protein [Aquibacillus kalidii]|uniref:hypothetical protein n=1 Tax=Aquibacillus kalidii TaxID=2762597 RepID=UPI0016481D5D|nr:hypothetical protein [Aquibacillus kalidii]
MIHLIIQRLKNRKTTSIFMLLAFISLLFLTTYGIHQSKESELAIKYTIEKYGRGSYDLLVRPENSRTNVERTLKVVEDNYIGDGQGGISLADWKDIQKNPNVEVAAPVASIGYFTGQQVSIELPKLDVPTRIKWQFFTSDGINQYPVTEPDQLVYFEETKPGLIQYIRDPISSNNSIAMTVIMPKNYYLLAAIDPESEEKLTNIDFSKLEKDPESEMLQSILDNYGNPPVVKVLQRKDINIPLFIDLQLDTINVQLDTYLDKMDLTKDNWLMEGAVNLEQFNPMYQELLKVPAKNTQNKLFNLSAFQSPFNGTALAITKDLKVIENGSFMTDHDTSIYFTASKTNYKNLKATPKVSIVRDGEPPSYKQVEKHGISMEESTEIPFLIHQMGKFEVKNKEPQLTSSPLGIYGDITAEAADGTELTATTIPGSFIPAPAAGVTTLEMAELIKGEKPIDAVRIKVAGITQYNKQSQEKIDLVARQLLEQGYEVDIVAASSFKKMTLDVEGIGAVTEDWTTLGIAQSLTESWNLFTLLSTGLFSFFGLLWIYIRLTFEKYVLEDENNLLSTVGWSNKKIKLRNSMEYYLLLLVAFFVSLIFIYFFHLPTNSYFVVIGLGIIALTFITVTMNRKLGNKLRTEPYKRFHSILYYKESIIPTAFILLISFILISLQVAVLGDNFAKASVTSLGKYALSETNGIQITILLIVYLLSTISISDCFYALIRKRENEYYMYYVIGWSKKRIRIHHLKEVIIWVAPSIILGILTTVVILTIFQISFLWIVLGVLVSMVTSLLTVSIIIWRIRLV